MLQVPSSDDNVFSNCFLFVHKFDIETEIVPRCAQNERKMHTKIDVMCRLQTLFNKNYFPY